MQSETQTPSRGGARPIGQVQVTGFGGGRHDTASRPGIYPERPSHPGRRSARATDEIDLACGRPPAADPGSRQAGALVSGTDGRTALPSGSQSGTGLES